MTGPFPVLALARSLLIPIRTRSLPALAPLEGCPLASFARTRLVMPRESLNRINRDQTAQVETMTEFSPFKIHLNVFNVYWNVHM